MTGENTERAMYSFRCTAAIARIDEAAESATLKDYYRAQSFRELALAYAKEADDQQRQRDVEKRLAGQFSTALDIIENTLADDILDDEFAILIDLILGKFVARSKVPALSNCAHEIRNLREELQKAATTKREPLLAVA